MSTPSGASVLRRLISVSPPPWRRLALAIGLGVAASGATVGLMAGSGALVDKAAERPGIGAIAGLLAVVEVIAVARAPLRYAERLAAHDAGFRALSGWRVWLFDRLEPLSPASLQSWRSGDLAERAVADVDGLQDLYVRGLAPLVLAAVVATAAVVVEGVLVPGAALALGVALLVALVGAPAIAWWARPRDAERAAAGELSADVVDLVYGSAELLAFGQSGAHLARIEHSAALLSRLARRRARAAGAASALVGACMAVAVAVVLVLAVDAVRAHHLEPIMLAVLPFTALGAFEVVPPLTAAAGGAGDVVSAGRRLLSLADVVAPVQDPDDPARPPGPPLGIRFDGAHLRYGDDLPFALDGVTFAAPAGTSTALVGPSGSGKSSVLRALLRFWPLHSGQASVGEVRIDRLTGHDARRLCAPVDQDAHLFAGTLRENVVFARPGAGDDEITGVLRDAQLAEWVATLPDGIDTRVGEGGAMLSGGQRQRVALARALLADRPLLLLDEPGAALDEETADRLLADVLAAARGRTVLTVTHRAPEAARCDQVIELDRGRVVPVRPEAPQRSGSDGTL